MKIPVFVSSPTSLSPDQEKARKKIFSILDSFNFEPRALGQSDYPTQLPLREVYTIAKHCSGGVILGFKQLEALSGKVKEGAAQESDITDPIFFPTPWNNLEAGILFSLKLPLLIFREDGITGGIFDNGVSDVFVHEMPPARLSKEKEKSLHAVFLKWQANVRNKYYEE